MAAVSFIVKTFGLGGRIQAISFRPHKTVSKKINIKKKFVHLKSYRNIAIDMKLSGKLTNRIPNTDNQ